MSYLYEFHVRRERRQFAHEGTGLQGPGDVVNFLQAHAKGLDREYFFVFHLDVRQKLIGFETVAIGGLAGVEVHPREVFRSAIISGAHSIIVAHNHPSGDCTPSPEDYILVKRLFEAGRLLGIEVLDSIIFADGDFHSMASSKPEDWK